jgi:GNAT superfamily N-acetyltransferase
MADREATTGVRVVMATDAEESVYAFSFAVNDERAAYLMQQLIAFNLPHASPLWQHPPHPPAPLQLYAQDAAGTVIGGVIGRTNAIPEWLEITIVWVDATYRGHGLGRHLVHLAEAEATRRGCRHARVNTAQFQAPDFYTKLGYTCYGKLENCPQGQTISYFHKVLL